MKSRLGSKSNPSSIIALIAIIFAILIGVYVVTRSHASATIATGASLARCGTSPCASGSFTTNFGTCGSTPQALPGNVVQLGSITNNEFNENYCYAWYKPANINATPAATVVVFAHCAGSSCSNAISRLGWQYVADHNALNIVYFYSPQDRTQGIPGYTYHGDTDYPPNSSPTPPCHTSCSDEPAIAAMVQDLLHGIGSTKINVDPQRIYSTGASSGGSIQNDIACTPNQNLFRGLSIVSASFQLAQSATTNGHEVPDSERCPTKVSHPFFVMKQHGTNDSNVPFNGLCNFGANDHCVASDVENRRFWSKQLGCDATPTDTKFGTPNANNVRHSYSNCTYGLSPGFVSETVTLGSHTDCSLNDIPALPSPTICPNATQSKTNGYFTAQSAWNFWSSSRWDTTTSPPSPPPPPTNVAPQVSLTAPIGGSSTVAGTTIAVKASASDSDGSVSGVDFYVGQTKIGSSASSPYGVSWASVAAGTYVLTARATDNDGAVTTSQPVTITVTNTPSVPDTTAPTVPVNLHATSTTSTAVTLAWSASTDTGGSGLSGYRLYRNGVLMASPTALTYTDTSLAAGTSYTYAILAYDGSGNSSAKSTGLTVSTPPAVRVGDLNGDQSINIFDLSILLGNFKSTNARGDLNQDGTVNIFDLSILLSKFGS